jgi:hypothetical protein
MIPIDLIVRTREQLNERLAMDDFFMREIVERGKVNVCPRYCEREQVSKELI